MKAIRKRRTAGVPTLPQDTAMYRAVFYRLLILGGMMVLVGQVIILSIGFKGFEEDLKPELSQKAIAVGRALTTEFSEAINGLGIPLEQLVGVEEYFAGILDSNEDIQFLALADTSPRLLYERNLPNELADQVLEDSYDSTESAISHQSRQLEEFSDNIFPLFSDGELIATLHVGVSGDVLRKQLASILYEVIAVILVSMVITLELLTMFMSIRMLAPTEHVQKVLEAGAKGRFTNRVLLNARSGIGSMVPSLNRLLYHLEQKYQDFQFELRELRDAQIDHSISKKIAGLKVAVDQRFRFSDELGQIEKTAALIRLPLFLFIFSEELTRPFFPLFVSGFVSIDPPLSYEMMLGLPITLFMVATFVATLFAGGLTYRLGCSRLFLIGIACAFVGYCGTFFSGSYIELVLWRCLNGVGYGLIFNASETWVALYSKGPDRARSASAFVGAVFAGFVCGPSMGGMFADYFGPQLTFLISAGLAVLSASAAYFLLKEPRELSSVEQEKPRMSGTFNAVTWKTLLSNMRFIGIVFTAVPTKATVSAFLFFLIPLYMNELGHTQAEIGQVMMLYGALILAGTILTSRVADYTRKYSTVLLLGMMLSGLGLVWMPAGSYLMSESQAVLVAIFVLGAGHCLIMSPQFAIMQEIAYKCRGTIEMPVSLSVYRFTDRLGLIIGPVLAAILVQKMSYISAIMSLGIMVLVSMLISFLAMKTYEQQEM